MESHRTNLFKNKGKDQDVSSYKHYYRVFQVPLIMNKSFLYDTGNAS